MHQSSLAKMKQFRSKFLGNQEGIALKILDLGSQDVNGTYRSIFDCPSWTYLGADVCPGKNVDIVLAQHCRWKEIRPASFDVVISGQALEHIAYFWITMLEIERVLKPDGLCCIIAPSGGFEHRYPLDCWRFYPDGFFALARWVRLEILQVETQWENLNYPDGSDVWHDTILVGRKPRAPLKGRLKRWLRNRILLTTLRASIPRDVR